MGHFNTYSTYS